MKDTNLTVPLSMTFGGGGEEDRYSTCSEVSSVQDLEDPPPNMLGTLLSEIYTQVCETFIDIHMTLVFARQIKSLRLARQARSQDRTGGLV